MLISGHKSLPILIFCSLQLWPRDITRAGLQGLEADFNDTLMTAYVLERLIRSLPVLRAGSTLYGTVAKAPSLQVCQYASNKRGLNSFVSITSRHAQSGQIPLVFTLVLCTRNSVQVFGTRNKRKIEGHVVLQPVIASLHL